MLSRRAILERMSVLTADERQHLTHEFNYVPRDYQKTNCVCRDLPQQADKTPEAIALSDGNTRWTYRQGKTAAKSPLHYNNWAKTGDRVGIA